MEHRENTIAGCRELELYCQRWLPPGPAKANLIIVHGLAEHSGRYAHLAERFARQGFAVYAMDHRGHGRSGGTRCYVDRFSDYADDLGTLFRHVRQERKDVPVFLVGHSMGGTIALAYALKHPDGLDGLVLSSPVLKSGNSISAVSKLIANALSALMPRLPVSALDAGAISRDPAVVQAYCSDPLVYHGRISARLGAEFLREMDTLRSRAGQLRMPLLVMYGAADRLADPTGSRDFYAQAGSTDKTLTVYENFFHEIFNDPERDRVFAEMAAWLQARL